MICFNGKTQSVTAWAKEVQMKPITLYHRLKNGWSVQKALETPVISTNELLLIFKGKKQNVRAWAKELNIKPVTLYRRLNKGWSVQKALETPVDIKKSYRKSAKNLEVLANKISSK